MHARTDDSLQLLGDVEIYLIVMYRSPAFLQGIGVAKGVIFTCPGFANPANPVTVKSF